MDTAKKYYAKLMLTGEYAVMLGGEALTVPLRKFYASLKQRDHASDPEILQKSFSSLKKLHAHIDNIPGKRFHAKVNSSIFNKLLDEEYYIDTSIPERYGVGSSAAVSAIIYDQFFETRTDLTLQQMQEDLAAIESCFHGRSSGVDALSSYLDSPLHFTARGPVILDIDPLQVLPAYRFFLLDSRTAYNTAPLVGYFTSQMNKSEFSEVISKDLLVLNTKFIGSLLNKAGHDAALIFRAISDLQWKHFRKMIPESIEDIWIGGQVSNTYYLKLNGSGGGYVLGITHQESITSTEEQLSDFKLVWL